MKKIRLLSLLAVSALVLTATSCQDESSTLPSSSLPSSISTNEPEPEEVSVTITNGDSASLFVGDTLQLEATVTGTDEAVTWFADMTNVITVSDTGLVTANAVGECTVTASVGDVSDSISITVERRSYTIDDVLAQIDDIALNGTFHIEMEYVDTGEVLTQDSTMVDYFRSDRYYNYEYDAEGTLLYASDYYRTDDGYVGSRSLDPLTNTVTTNYLYNSYDELVSFDDNYANPFVDLDVTDLRETEDGILVDVDDDTSTSLGTYLTMYNYLFQDIYIQVDDYYEVTGITVYGEEEGMVDSYGDVANVTVSGDFEVVSKESAGITEVEPRIESSATDALADLFTSLQDRNYTLDIYNDYDGTITESTYLVDGDLYIIDDTAGYVDTGSGVYDFVLEGGSLVGQSSATVAESLDDIFPSYTALASMFDVDGDTYSLATGLGLENYADEYIPLPNNDTMFYATADDGTLQFVDNGDGTWTLSYSTTTSFFGMVWTDSYEITISNIGTTDTGYEASDYVAPIPQASWDDVDGTDSFFEELPQELLPFWLPEGGEWSASSSFLSLALPSGYDPEQAAIDYGEILVDAGWEANGLNDYGEDEYLYEVGAVIYNIGIAVLSSSIQVWVYTPEVAYEDTELSNWLNDNFSDPSTINYTANLSVDSTIFPAEIIDGEPQITSTLPIDETVMATSTMYVTPQGYYNVGSLGVDLYDNRVSGTTDIYGAEESGDALIFSESNDANWTDLLYSMYDISTANQFIYDDEQEAYVTDDSDLLDTIVSIGGIVVSQTYTPISALFELDTETNTLVITYDLYLNYVYLDETQTTIGYQQCLATLTINNIGTTSIDFDALLG